MIKWLLRQWHRFTLGSTATVVYGNVFATRGTTARVAGEIQEVLDRELPVGVYFEICERRATDLNQPSTIRIVIETRQ